MQQPMIDIAGYSTSRLRLTEEVSTRALDTGGANPPLVLIHGLAASIEIWREVIAPLAEDFRVLAFDLPGFGHADKPDADYRALTFFVPMLRAFMDAMGLDRAHMVGSSMGASLIVRYGARHGQTIDRAVLANPGGFGRYIHPFLRAPTMPLVGGVMSRPQRFLNAFAVGLAIHDKARRTEELIDEADRFSRLPGAHRAFVRTLRGLASPLGVKELRMFEREARMFAAPALVVWGKQDRIFPVAQVQTVQRFMPGARVEVLDGVGHYPQIDRPGAFVRLVRGHLRGETQTVSTQAASSIARAV